MRARRRSRSGLSPSSSSLPSRAMSLGSSFLGVLRALASHKLLLLFVPLLFMLIGTQVVVEHEPNLAPARKVINGVLAAIGVAVTLYLGVRVLGDWSGFCTRKNAEDFLVAPVFTLGLVPFLCLVAWESSRELDNLRKRWSPAADSTAWEH